MDFFSLPKFFHGRKPKIERNNHETEVLAHHIKSPKSPLNERILWSIFRELSTKEPNLPYKKLNLKQSLLKHVSYGLNFEESLTYRELDIFPQKPFIKVLLIDSSFSMKAALDDILNIIEKSTYHIMFYHDVDLHDYSFKKPSKIKFIGGTSHAKPLKRIHQVSEDLGVVLQIEHISDAEISNRDQLETYQIIKKIDHGSSEYELIMPAYFKT
ncbi:hypothetical protein [Tenuibacillus multivorans]|uniref:Uncharacterized protein n=1 Tax=Tenuibacillus multivorans TaxID=237069 RepID=A0A1H0EUR3_9BACI|nr:hypothetical protein [Tenuibacillus multivorans]GEL76945.1 hypothetical protein TMU01_11800 [Tenuibacillus multivorans]SDN86177.1 hypothetical protein SAMN05216498_0074 [Tenuibacillus multivorans]